MTESESTISHLHPFHLLNITHQTKINSILLFKYLISPESQKFVLFDAVMLGKVITQLKTKSCFFSPTSFSVNYSCQTGAVSTTFKAAMVKPVLKINYF